MYHDIMRCWWRYRMQQYDQIMARIERGMLSRAVLRSSYGLEPPAPAPGAEEGG